MNAITIFDVIGYGASIMLALMLVPALFGGDADVEMEFDADGDIDIGDDLGNGPPVLTVKNFLGFMAGFGLMGSYCLTEGMTLGTAIISGTVSGLVLAGLTMAMLYFSNKMDSNPKPDYKALLEGTTSTLYLGFPAGGQGKLLISVAGTVKEFACFHEDNTVSMKTNEKVKLILVNNDLTIVIK